MKKFLLAGALLLAGCTVVSNRSSVVTDSQAAYLSFDITPVDAKVFVDNEFVGLAKYFNGKKRRLKIQPGQHVVEIKRDGYQDIRKTFYMSDTQEHLQYNMAPVEGDRGKAVIRT